MGKEGERTTEEMVNKFAAKSVSNYPKPDFSAMSEWYEVINYEYPKPGGDKMIIYFKPKGKERPLFFNMEYRDKNGVLVVGWAVPICCSTALGDTETGPQEYKLYTCLPKVKWREWFLQKWLFLIN